MPYLTAGNTSFRDAVYRTVGFQTAELKTVVKAVADYQAIPNVHQFRSLTEALDAWRVSNPNEYRNRLSGIQPQFDNELAQQGALYVPATPNNNMAWVKAVSNQLEPFKQYAVGDILAYRDNANQGTLQACLARYLDFAQSKVPPARRSAMKPAPFQVSTQWNANRARMFWEFTAYALPRTVRYNTGVPNPTIDPSGACTTQSIGCAICTEFAFAAAHVLTNGRVGGPKVEVVSWSGGGSAAHVYCLVGRAPGLTGKKLSARSTWGADCVVVDTWLAALGHKVAYWAGNSEYPFPYFLDGPVSLVMET